MPASPPFHCTELPSFTSFWISFHAPLHDRSSTNITTAVLPLSLSTSPHILGNALAASSTTPSATMSSSFRFLFLPRWLCSRHLSSACVEARKEQRYQNPHSRPLNRLIVLRRGRARCFRRRRLGCLRGKVSDLPRRLRVSVYVALHIGNVSHFGRSQVVQKLKVDSMVGR
jgi:hypothetical protein